MEDYTHLRKAHKDEDKETLLGRELSPTEAKQCLDTMKEISGLIEQVRLLFLPKNLLIYYYIGSHYLPQIRVYLLILLYCRFRRSPRIHCGKRDRVFLHNCSIRYRRLHIYSFWIHRDENCSLYKCENN